MSSPPPQAVKRLAPFVFKQSDPNAVWGFAINDHKRETLQANTPKDLTAVIISKTQVPKFERFNACAKFFLKSVGQIRASCRFIVINRFVNEAR